MAKKKKEAKPTPANGALTPKKRKSKYDIVFLKRFGSVQSKKSPMLPVIMKSGI